MSTKQPMKTPVIGTCIRTGTKYHAPSMAAVSEDGYSSNKVRDCVRGRAKTHAGMTWEAVGPLRPARPGYGNRTGEAATLYNSGMNSGQVANRMGVTLSTAKYYISCARSMGTIIRKG